MKCDFCWTIIEPIYKHVYLCDNCGLVQNEPRSDRTISTSCEADQGNLRNGKGFRFGQSVPILESINWTEINTVLDIGSNRGAFVRWMLQHHQTKQLTACEPEKALIDYASPKVFPCKFENMPGNDLFDLIFCSHTLEHAQSAAEMLSGIERRMKIGSYLLLEVPNLATIMDPRAVEEFFIYKHNFHFSRQALKQFLLDLGLVVERDDSTQFDIRFLIRKRLPARAFAPISQKPAQYARHWIDGYAKALEANRGVLPEVVWKLNEMGNVIYWGAGRIFDALIRFGGLKPEDVPLLVDRYLADVVSEIHGIPLRTPEALRWRRLDALIILARTSNDEMKAEAQMYAPRVVTFNDLLDAVLEEAA